MTYPYTVTRDRDGKLRAGVELDLYWNPVTLRAIQQNERRTA